MRRAIVRITMISGKPMPKIFTQTSNRALVISIEKKIPVKPGQQGY
jgi:hypothetical protein